MKTLLLAFSDGSRQFSTSVVYLVSYNDNGPEYTVNIVSSLSRLGKISKKEGEEGDMCTVPKRECHGLFLATCGVSSLANLLYQLKIPLTKVFIFSDAIAHIIALKKSPACFQLPYSRLYAEINSLTFQIGQLTSQPKEDIVRFLHQKFYANPADWLSKFDLDSDSVNSWVLKAQMLYRPPWLQKHPHEYIPELLKISDKQMALQASGGDENIFRVTEKNT